MPETETKPATAISHCIRCNNDGCISINLENFAFKCSECDAAFNTVDVDEVIFSLQRMNQLNRAVMSANARE